MNEIHIRPFNNNTLKAEKNQLCNLCKSFHWLIDSVYSLKGEKKQTIAINPHRRATPPPHLLQHLNNPGGFSRCLCWIYFLSSLPLVVRTLFRNKTHSSGLTELLISSSLSAATLQPGKVAAPDQCHLFSLLRLPSLFFSPPTDPRPAADADARHRPGAFTCKIH